jgi:hypothetical protein
MIADCGKQDATTTVTDLDDIDGFKECSTFYGSLYFHTGTDAEYNNITMPAELGAITGGLYCSGGGNDTTTDSINAPVLASVATNPTEPTTGGVGFVIVDYPTLTSLTFPDLAAVGSNFIIARNPRLTTISFPSLISVTGNIDVTGDIQSLELTSLTIVNGSVNIQTSLASFSCPSFAKVLILGAYSCSVGVNNPQPLPMDNSTTNSPPINPIPASSPSSSSVIIISSQGTSTSAAQSATSSPSSTAGATKSSASATRISGIGLIIGFTQICCLFFLF